MQLGFEVSDLYPEKAGVHTYGVELLRHLSVIDHPPELTLVDALGQRSLREVLSVVDLGMSDCSFARGFKLRYLSCRECRKWPLLRSHPITRAIDGFTVGALWDFVRTSPRLARYLVPHAVNGLDVCHWSNQTFLPLLGPASVTAILDTIPLSQPQLCPEDLVRHEYVRLSMIKRFATRVIAISEHTRRDIVTHVGIPSDQIDVIPLAANESFQPPRDRDGQERLLRDYALTRGDYVLYVGTIEPRKNLVRLAQAFKSTIRSSQLPTTKLVIAGKRGWLTKSIDEGLAQVGLGNRMLLLGRVPQENLPSLLNGAAVVAYVSLFEGFGLPPLEAMACGSAVVASNTTSLPEVVGDAGLSVDPYNTREIADALTAVLSNSQLRTELQNRGLRRAAQFSWEKTARMTMDTYQQAVEDHAYRVSR
jgi:glycosyltransferase involved in cell wall biosynthesis